MDSPLKIYSGANALIYSTPVNTGCRRKVQLMSEDSIMVKFSYKNRIIFPVGSRIGDFYTTEEQQGKYNANTAGYDYELKFSAYYWLWANKLLSYVMPGVTNAPKETSFNLTAPIETHAAIILRALNALGCTYNNSPFRVDTDADFSTEAKYIQYSNMSILGGIQAIAEAYECEWWVEGNAIHFGKCHASGEYDFTVGDNVSAITQSNTSKKGNRLFVFGSDRNLPPDYRTVDDADVVDAIVTRRLMLPAGTPYLQIADNIPEDQIVEEEVVFDKVYPRTQLTISNITTYTSQAEDGKTQTFYRINYGNSFPFLKEYILPDEELHIVFESGDLNGMDFAVKFNPLGVGEKNDDGSINPASQMFEIVVNEDYGRELPDSVLHPDVGDKFMLYGWNAKKMESLGLIAAAEQELLTEGNKEVEERKKDLATYTCPMMWDWCKAKSESNDMPKLGSIVNLHFETGDTGRKSRVIGYEHDLDIEYSNVTYTCGEKVSASRLKTLESKVDGLTHNGTKAKFQNSLDFLSKRYSDRTPYQLSSDIGFEAGNFTSGVSGGMFGIDKTDGSSFAEVDDMRVRRKAYFETLTTMEATTLAGKHYITPGGSIKCVRVEEVKDTDGDVTAYRCWFLSEQSGEKTDTKIIEDDQCISEMFNAKTGTANKVTNHRYWRLVTGVSNDAHTDDAGNHYGYIDLSATDCEPDSDIPQEGDVLAQFGNRTDVSRQGAIVLSAVDFDAPAIKMLAGIGSGDTAAEHYSLDGKDITAQGYDHTKGHAYMKVYGDTYIGAKDKSTYFNFDQDTKSLDIKAVVNILGGSVIDGELTLLSLMRAGYRQDDVLFKTMAGMNGSWIPELGGRTIASWWGGPMVDLFDQNGNRLNLAAGTYATSLVRMDGSFYLSNGNIGGRNDGSGWLAGDNITWDKYGAITFGNGIKIDLGGGHNTTLGGLQNSIASVDLLLNKLANLFTPYLGTQEKTWADVSTNADYDNVRLKAGLWTDGFLSAHGQNSQGGQGIQGKSYLSDLLDVDLDTLLDGQVLVYRNGKWTNETIEAASLAGYALESWVEANFVTLDTAQTITGAKTFGASVTAARFVKSGGTASQVLMADGSVQNHYKAASVTTATLDIGMITPFAMNQWTSKTFVKQSAYTAEDVLAKVKTVDGAGSGLDADLLDGHHRTDFNAVAQFGTTAQPSGYYKIKIKSTAAWMLGFKVLVYHSYCFDEINISGYNYGSSYWYSPSVSLVSSQGKSPKSTINVIFGYDSARNLWVAIPAQSYAGITVTDVTNGFEQVTDTHSLFEIVLESTLTGTTQTTVTASRHATLTDNVASATKLQTARTIWGQSFDGTANVTGLIKADSGIQIGGTTDIGWYLNSSRICAGSGTARGVNVGSLLVSNAWVDATKVPTNGIYSKGAVRIGDCTISWDAANGMLKFDKGLYSEGGVSAHGVNKNAGGGGSDSGNYLDINASNATYLAMPNLIAKISESDDLCPYDTDYFVVGDSSYGYDYCAKFKMTGLWRYIKGKADGSYLCADGAGATEFTLYNMMQPCMTNSAVDDNDLFFVASAEYSEGAVLYASSLWAYIKSKMGLAFTVDGDNVAIGCQPGTLTLNGVTINSGSAITCNSLTTQGMTAYDVTIGGPSANCVKIKYQGKTYTLQLAKLIQAGYLTA